MDKLQGLDFWRKSLQGARYVLAPMVDQSELAWRLLSRRHGAQLCYTPMIHAQVFVRDPNYRKENLYCELCPEDRPLIVQFCANDPEVFVQAALLAQDYCDAVDLNLGCPQMIAKRGHYGAFLQEEWDLLEKMIQLAHQKLSVPITCKIRVFEEIEKTVKYAKLLEKAGCQLLTVHGRTKEQKGRLTGVASWEHIKAVRNAVNIPVFANGNIQYLSDVDRCIQETGVQGVMSAEGNLHNPALFEGRSPVIWEMSQEYIDLVQQYPCPLSFVRGHLFKLWHHTTQLEHFSQMTARIQSAAATTECILVEAELKGPPIGNTKGFPFTPQNSARGISKWVEQRIYRLQVYQELREDLAKAKSLEAVIAVNNELKVKCQQEEMARKEGDEIAGLLPFPHWICQPYVRPLPKDTVTEESAMRPKRALEDDGNTEQLSKNKLKKKLRNLHKNLDSSVKPKYAKCDQCGNPKGTKCVFHLCRSCCKKIAFREMADCAGHGLLFKTKYERSAQCKAAQEADGPEENLTESKLPQPPPEIKV